MKLTSEIIRVCRVNLGLSQGQLAKRSNISCPLMGAIEREERTITPDVERRIRAAIPLSDKEIAELLEVNRKIQGKMSG
ncbi:helix-turn-helix domain-containing protein [Paenibacillus alvei]|uniref:Helix-turn-helix transcriptional regulator n=1 Tax=Paenibacillus alvei TaxID=44250 RepID=A0AAP6ZWV0_PAEAL|nr:helix-turn-helix transcriptional regulator [Paenibacillus alvei]NOJ71418.1 helix-turn-helix transcriptional regulator [Paenibacillus alvei]